MNKTSTPSRNGFSVRKAARKHHYETYVKGWRLRDCPACNGQSLRPSTTPCPTCSGNGRKRALPDCVTEIESLIGKTIRIEVIPYVELRLHIQTHRRVIKQFISTHDGARDPRIYDKLEFGYDEKNNTEDWYVTDTFGGRFYLHQFEQLNQEKTA
jgi:hypothetical protein